MKPISPSSQMLSKLHVITVISNPVRYHSRYEHYENFKKHMEAAGAILHTVEIAFGDRPFEVTGRNKRSFMDLVSGAPACENPNEIQFRSFDEIWHKENMINLAIARLPQDWEYVAWIDADIMFQNPYWLTETVQQLQHHMVVQMFAEAIDLGPRHEIMQKHRGFVKAYIDGGCTFPNKKNWSYYGGPSGSFAHPGYAWAARREAIDHLGGLIDFAVLGSGDHHMACALIGEAQRTFPSQIASRYADKIIRWQDRALKYLHRDIGFVDGTISHYFHGKKADRKYQDRWSILTGNNFDPDLDLKRDWQGLYLWTDNNYKIRDAVRAYNRGRNEDSIDV